MGFIFKPVRWVLGQIIIFIAWVTRPKPVQRPPETQKEVDAQTASMVLYHFQQCPFCVKTRRQIYRLALNIENRDARPFVFFNIQHVHTEWRRAKQRIVNNDDAPDVIAQKIGNEARFKILPALADLIPVGQAILVGIRILPADPQTIPIQGQRFGIFAVQAKRHQVGPIHFGVQVGFVNFQWCFDVVIMT